MCSRTCVEDSILCLAFWFEFDRSRTIKVGRWWYVYLDVKDSRHSSTPLSISLRQTKRDNYYSF